MKFIKPFRLIVIYLVFFIINGFFYCIVLNFNNKLRNEHCELLVTIQNQEHKITELVVNQKCHNYFNKMSEYEQLKKKN